MPTVEEKLRVLNESQTRLRNHQGKTWAQKQKAKQEYEYNQRMIADLEKYQELRLNDWVTNQKEIEIRDLSFSPGGMPQVWVNWNDSVPIIVHRLDSTTCTGGELESWFFLGRFSSFSSRYLSSSAIRHDCSVCLE